MDCMDLFYKMKGKDIHVHGEGVNWKCGCCSISGGIPQSKGDQRGQEHQRTALVVGKDQLRVSPGMFSLTQSGH